MWKLGSRRKTNPTMAICRLRWMIRSDLPEVVRIERDAFGDEAWSEGEFIECLRIRDCIGMVADVGEDLVGYMIYRLHWDRLQLLNLAVDEKHRFSGHGRAMCERLGEKLNDRRRRVTCLVRERNVTAQVFFRAVGWRCVEIMREPYFECDEDGYLFERRYVDVIAQGHADYFAGVE